VYAFAIISQQTANIKLFLKLKLYSLQRKRLPAPSYLDRVFYWIFGDIQKGKSSFSILWVLKIKIYGKNMPENQETQQLFIQFINYVW
jgi:hypothetical protein